MSDFPERIQSLQPFWGVWYLDAPLGEGGFGKVYRIYREEFGTRYYAAMKWLSLPASQSEVVTMRARGMNDDDIRRYLDQQVQELQSEIKLMSSLRGSSHIVSYEDHAFIRRNGEIGWDILIRMELLTALPARLAAGMTVGDVVRMGIDMCDALSVCARMRIIHRDIKPDNIFVNRIGDYKLGDFGVARRTQNEFTHMSVKGTPVYMAPEVYGGKTGDNSVDQYSLGLVMHRLLNAHQIPFAPAFDRVLTHDEREQAFSRRLNGETIPAPLQGSDKLRAAICKACSFQAKKRFASPEEFKKALEATLNDKECAEPLLTMSAAKISSKRSTLDGKKKLSTPMVIAGAGIVVLVATLVVILGLALSGDKPDNGRTTPTIAEQSSMPEPWKGLAVVTEPDTMLYSSYLTAAILHPLETDEVVQVIGQQEENGKLWLTVQAGDEWGYVQDGAVQPMSDGEATAYYLSLASPEPTEVLTEVPTATPTEEPTDEPTAEPTATPTEEPTATLTPTPTQVPTEVPTPDPITNDSAARDQLTAFFHFWSVNMFDEMVTLTPPSWRASVNDPRTELLSILANRTLTSHEIMNISGTDADTSRTATVRASIDKHYGYEEVYLFTVVMKKEDGIWYVDPKSLATNERESATPAAANTTPTQAPLTTAYPGMTLYYIPNGGSYYHIDDHCPSAAAANLPFKGSFTWEQRNDEPYSKLTPCNRCGAPLRNALDSLSSYGYISAIMVNFRNGAGTNSSRNATYPTLKQYAFCFVLGTQKIGNTIWYNVNYNGEEGYLSGEYFYQMTVTELEDFINSPEYQQGLVNNNITQDPLAGTGMSGLSSYEE